MKFMAHWVLDHRAPIAVMDNYNLCFGALWKFKEWLVSGSGFLCNIKWHLSQDHVNNIGCRVSCCCLQDSKHLKRPMIQPEPLTCAGVIESVTPPWPWPDKKRMRPCWKWCELQCPQIGEAGDSAPKREPVLPETEGKGLLGDPANAWSFIRDSTFNLISSQSPSPKAGVSDQMKVHWFHEGTELLASKFISPSSSGPDFAFEAAPS